MAENSRRSPMESADAIVFLVGGALAGDLAGANTSAGGGFPTRCAMRGRWQSSTIVHARIDSAWAQGGEGGGQALPMASKTGGMQYRPVQRASTALGGGEGGGQAPPMASKTGGCSTGWCRGRR
uniref:Uncharacterized protein n=1 Tax=Oryza rufipogon TaxID=4529 RepID=A0A0E0P4V1_ORYRU